MSDLELYRFRPRRLTRWQQVKESIRSYTLAPLSAKSKELADRWSHGPVRSGVTVNEATAFNYSAVWAAVNLVSAGVSSVPLSLYRVLGEGKGKEEFKNHSTYRLLHDQPNPQMGSMVFRRTLQAHAMVWGNGYAEIVRDAAGRPRELWPLLPYAVQPFVESGVLRYRCYNPGGSTVVVDATDIVHVRGLSNDGVCGYPTIGNARESIGLGIAAEQFGSTFFGNGSTFGGVIKYPAGVATNPQTRKDNAEALKKAHQGVDNAHRLLAIYEGADFTALGVPPNMAQFLETRQFQIEEVCRWFNVAPHKLHHLLRTSYNSIEHSAIEYDMDTLNPWWVTWEQELQYKLVAPLEQSQQRVEHVRQGRLQADVASRGTFYQTSFNVGSVTPNEIRGLENRNPILGGDQSFVMNNLIPLELATEYWKAEIEAKKQKTQPPPPPPRNGDDDRAIEELKEQLIAARQCQQTAEDVKDLEIHKRGQAEADKATAVAAQASLQAELQQEKQAHATTAVERVRAIQDWDSARADRAKAVEDLQSTGLALQAAQTEARTLTDRLSDTQSDLEATQAREAAVIAERDTARAEVQAESALRIAAESQSVSLTEARDAEIAGRAEDREAHEKVIGELTAAKAGVEAERDAAVAQAVQVEAERDAARGELEAVRSEREQELKASGKALELLQGLRRTVETERDTAAAERETALALAAQAEQERAAMKTEVEALGESLRTANETAAGLLEDRQALATRVQVVEAERDSLTSESEALRTDIARARADLATELDRQQTQRATLLAAMRSLVVDVNERLLQKEADRARKNQATPEKFRAWLEAFYPLHTETVRAAFRPLVGPWTAVTGGAPNLLLDRLVSAHVSESSEALRQVLDGDDDARASTLERVLRRWEDERAEAVADALVREGMAEHG